MARSIVERVVAESGVPGLLDVLASHLSGSDLQSLMLEVYRRRAAGVSPGRLAEQYRRDRFVRPSDLDPRALLEFDRLAFSLLDDGFEPLELSPVGPLGTSSAVASVDQNKVLSTSRNTELVADSTGVLALECARRRRERLRTDRRDRTRVRLATSHRLLRAQGLRGPHEVAHFRLFALCTAGRDEGSLRFETESLDAHISFYLRLMSRAPEIGLEFRNVRVGVTELAGDRDHQRLRRGLIEPLAARFPAVEIGFDSERAGGRGYYDPICFGIWADSAAGERLFLADGGFTPWTQKLLSSRKERLLGSGIGTERACSAFRSSTSRSAPS